jgi:phosphoribosylformylglycinamidine cyclo-ligase
MALAREGLVRSAAHVTGGGFPENLPRALPAGMGVELATGSWPVPPIFPMLQEASGASDDDMAGTFNMGLGMVLVVEPSAADEVLRRSTHEAFRVGRVVTGSGVRFI